VVAGGVVERAQHPGDVAQWAHQRAALVERAGRLALEVEDDPAVIGAQHLAEVVVAVDALQPHRRGELGDVRVGSRELGHVRAQVGDGGRRDVQPLDHLVRHRPLRGVGGASGWQRRAQVGVHRRRHPAEPMGLRCEVTAGLVGLLRQVVQQVAHAGDRQAPAVGAPAQEGLQQSEGRGEVGRDVLVPPLRRRDHGRPDRRQRPGHLEVGVESGRGDLPEDLEDVVVTEDDRRVALLAAEQPARPVDERLRAAERDRSDRPARLDLVEQHAGELGVVQRVVGAVALAVALDRTDRGVLEVVGQLAAQPQRQLVAVDRPGAVLAVDQHQVQLRVVTAEGGRDEAAGTAERASLAGVPALAGEPARQRVVEPGERHEYSCLTWNQKDPCGASVSR
jgi:hypothetical protein